MTDDPTPEAIADATLTTLVGCTRRRDLPGALDLFLDDAALFGSDDVVWFVAQAQAILEGEGAPPPVPYRLSGVLRLVSGSWRFVPFNGAQPVAE
jgi:SnoaL-like domain